MPTNVLEFFFFYFLMMILSIKEVYIRTCGEF